MTPEEKEWQKDLEYHNSLFAAGDTNPASTASRVHREEIRTTPLFSAEVLRKVVEASREPGAQTGNLLSQYGLLAKVLDTFNSKEDEDADETEGQNQATREEALGQPTPDERASPPRPGGNRLFVNMNAPWSAFICGSQGSGKSHTLSCMLEAALWQPDLGKLSKPLSAMVFHYDKYNSYSSSQICEAAYLSSEIPVKVLVSPSNFKTMKKAYENMPGFPQNEKKPIVKPLVLFEEQLNLERMMTLMAVGVKDGNPPLYIEVRSVIFCLSGILAVSVQP